jgi:hypothetical protein
MSLVKLNLESHHKGHLTEADKASTAPSPHSIIELNHNIAIIELHIQEQRFVPERPTDASHDYRGHRYHRREMKRGAEELLTIC